MEDLKVKKTLHIYSPGVATVTVRMKALMHHMRVFSLGNHFSDF